MKYRILAESATTKKVHSSKWYSTIGEATVILKKLSESDDFVDVKMDEEEGDVETLVTVDAVPSVVSQLDEIAEMADELYSLDSTVAFTDEETQTVADIQGALSDVYASVMERVPADTATETVSEEVAGDEVNLSKLRALAKMGLVSEDEVPTILRAVLALQNDKPIPADQREAVNALLMKLLSLITGDASIFQKIKVSL